MRIAIRSIYGIGAKLAVDVLNSSGEVIKTNGYDYKNMEVSK